MGLRSAKRVRFASLEAGLTEHCFDLSDPDVKRKLLEDILKNIYGELEIEYLIKILKSNYSQSMDDEQGSSLVKNASDLKADSKMREDLVPKFEKALDTLEVLMQKLGFRDQFQRVLDSYDTEVRDHL